MFKENSKNEYCRSNFKLLYNEMSVFSKVLRKREKREFIHYFSELVSRMLRLESIPISGRCEAEWVRANMREETENTGRA